MKKVISFLCFMFILSITILFIPRQNQYPIFYEQHEEDDLLEIYAVCYKTNNLDVVSVPYIDEYSTIENIILYYTIYCNRLESGYYSPINNGTRLISYEETDEGELIILLSNMFLLSYDVSTALECLSLSFERNGFKNINIDIK